MRIDSVECFKSRSKNPGPIRVQLTSKDDVLLVLQNKQKLAEYEDLDTVHIESFKSKNDVIMRDNWNTILRLMGDAGKAVRVAGNGRIIRKGEHGNRRPREGGNAAGETTHTEPTTSAGNAVPGPRGAPTPPIDAAQALPKRKRKKRRTAKKNGTNGVPKSGEGATTETPASRATGKPADNAVAEGETKDSQEATQMSRSPTAESTEHVIAAVEKDSGKMNGDQAVSAIEEGPRTRAKVSKVNPGTEITTQPEAPNANMPVTAEPEAAVAPTATVEKKTSPWKKLWSNRTK